MKKLSSPTVFRMKLAIGVLLVNIVVVVLLTISVRQSRLQYEEMAAITTQNLSQVLEEYINGVITKTDSALQTIADEAEKQLVGGGINRRVLNAYINRQKARITEIDSLRVSDEHGFVLYGTSVVPSSTINVADRDYFIYLSKNTKSRIFISKPMIGRISAKRVMVIARRFNRPNGSFGGVVYIAIILENFAEAFSRVNVGKHGVVTLFDDEITIISRYPEPQQNGSIVGKKSKSADIQELFRRGQTSVTYKARSTIDGIQRIYSFRKIYSYPLYILVGLAKEDYLTKWWNETAQMSAMLALFFFVTLVLVRLLYRYIHERNQAEDELRDAIDKLEAANKELDAFSYSVSHDLRAPLRQISGFVGLLQKIVVDYPNEKTLKYMDAIAGASKKMAMLIDDLLAFSKIGRMEMKKTKVSLNDLIREVIREIQDELKRENLVLKIDELPDVYGDQSLLRLVLVNLLSNAFKYTSNSPQAEIRIGYTYEGDEFILFVKDNGAGFDMKNVNQLFGVFQRLHTQEEFEGTGIGLANVRRMIARHGGRTWAEGAVGQGATFYFSLPMKGS